jgi:peptidyl-prolyl cis-trans isomerase D
VLDGLIERKVLMLAAIHQGFRTPDSYFTEVVSQIPEFQDNGVFSAQRFNAALRERGLSPAQFESELNEGYVLNALSSPVSLGEFTSRTSVSQLARLIAQQREVSYYELPATAVAAQVKVSEADIASYYASHKAEFTDPEKVRVEYLTLTLDVALTGAAVSDDEIKAYYQGNLARYTQPEQRSASHILIAVPAGASAAVKAQARVKTNKLAEDVRAAPATFGAVARKTSQDPGSAEHDGSLGSFGRGAMTKPFDDAVFSMKPGEIRGPVETEFGYHIIRLDGVQPGKVTALDLVKPEIEQALRKEKAQKKFADIAETFSNVVYEKPNSLKPAADALKLTVVSSDWFSPKQAPAPFANPKLAQALFSADSIKNKQNTEAVEIAPNVLVSARVTDYRPATLRTLADAHADILKKLDTERTAKLLAVRGAETIKALRAGSESGAGWSAFKVVSRQDNNGGFDAQTLSLIFRADTGKLPAYTGFSNADGSYRIIRISRVLDGNIDRKLFDAIGAGVLQTVQQADLKAMVVLAKAGHKIEIKTDALDVK